MIKDLTAMSFIDFFQKIKHENDVNVVVFVF